MAMRLQGKSSFATWQFKNVDSYAYEVAEVAILETMCFILKKKRCEFRNDFGNCLNWYFGYI